MCIDHITGFKLKQKTESNHFSHEGSAENMPSENMDCMKTKKIVSSSCSDISLIKCYEGPGHINEQRKFKRRCLGIHTYPVLFDR